ncbi:hypothetical protein LRY60_00480 [Candidatus Woesebacteria bacterium]|nr:hypothetical protein [Candidatus Woesebacteria bacterium]
MEDVKAEIETFIFSKKTKNTVRMPFLDRFIQCVFQYYSDYESQGFFLPSVKAEELNKRFAEFLEVLSVLRRIAELEQNTDIDMVLSRYVESARDMQNSKIVNAYIKKRYKNSVNVILYDIGNKVLAGDWDFSREMDRAAKLYDFLGSVSLDTLSTRQLQLVHQHLILISYFSPELFARAFARYPRAQAMYRELVNDMRKDEEQGLTPRYYRKPEDWKKALTRYGANVRKNPDVERQVVFLAFQFFMAMHQLPESEHPYFEKYRSECIAFLNKKQRDPSNFGSTEEEKQLVADFLQLHR